MTSEKILEVIGIYRSYFVSHKIGKIDYPQDKKFLDCGEGKLGLAHCHGMLDKMASFVNEKRIDKAFRWLGFIQGVLWVKGVYSLNILKNHSRPPDS